MTRLGLTPYAGVAGPPPRSVPVAALVLTYNEQANIARCLRSLGWAEQVVVVDSGSTDGTIELATAMGAEVVHHPWPGYGAQREFALRLPQLRHPWAYFVDADEWVSDGLAAEVASVLRQPTCDAYAQRRRLVFQGRWIRHCGWYSGSWLVRLMRPDRARFDAAASGERAQVSGLMGRLRHDLVDEDTKGLAAWLHKHVAYAELEAAAELGRPGLAARWAALRRSRAEDTRPLARAVAKDLVYPVLPLRPLAMFVYMYLVRAGFLDGVAGLRFCLYHAWYRMTIQALVAERRRVMGARLPEGSGARSQGMTTREPT
ncbi:MAG: glycosyltransferase family 2 protein [Actinomycetota bacterium]